MTRLLINILQAMDMACWGLIPRFWVKDKGFKEDDAVWGENAQKSKPADPPPEATELREGAFVAKILCDDREEEMEENMEQVSVFRTYLEHTESVQEWWTFKTLVLFLGERHGGQHQEHGQRHEHGAGEAEPDTRQDQRQGRLRHPEGQDG